MDKKEIVKKIIDNLIDFIREEQPMNGTFGITIRFKYNQFMNSMTKRISYALESENGLLTVDDLKQTIILSIIRASEYFNDKELKEILDEDFDMSKPIVQRFYQCACKLARYDIYMLTSVKYRKPNDETEGYYTTKYLSEYETDVDGDDASKLLENLLHNKMKKMMPKKTKINTPLGVFIYETDLITKDIKQNNVDFLFEGDRNDMSKSAYDAKIQALKVSIRKGIEASGLDIQNMSRREARAYAIAYSIYQVCNGSETADGVIKLIDKFRELEEYLVDEYSKIGSNELVELYRGTIDNDSFMGLVTKIICYANDICKKYNFRIVYKYKSIDVETEDEVYYFDKTHIKKSLGIKDVYVITRVLSGERNHYKGLKFIEIG
ncbi:MAG: hypothetical protein MSA56_10435 [Clostridium sp.]|nr:hypothetical protein [Clostridium sp.]